MGRGRQKAKQTKVARALKYYSPETDYEALQRELASPHDVDDVEPTPAGDDEDLDAWERWASEHKG
ncbi:MAG: DUF3073 domain-containing protein [Actinomycetota bacterium]